MIRKQKIAFLYGFYMNAFSQIVFVWKQMLVICNNHVFFSAPEIIKELEVQILYTNKRIFAFPMLLNVKCRGKKKSYIKSLKVCKSSRTFANGGKECKTFSLESCRWWRLKSREIQHPLYHFDCFRLLKTSDLIFLKNIKSLDDINWI